MLHACSKQVAAGEKERKELMFKFKCVHCNYMTGRKWALKRHFLSHTPTPERKFKCSYCKYLTATKSSLKRHLLTHKTLEERQKNIRAFTYICMPRLHLYDEEEMGYGTSCSPSQTTRRT